MKTFNLASINKPRFLFALVLFLPFATQAEIQKNNISGNNIDTNTVNILVENILKETEDALRKVKSEPDNSLEHVKSAITTIHSLERQLSPDTHVENKSPLIVDNSKEYWFAYPSIRKEVVDNKTMFPTIHTKFESGILYQGSSTDVKDQFNAYFDYPLAHASLITAREALVANNEREAISSLKWVFEAIYISPDFYVADLEDEFLMDKLFNLKGEFPSFTSLTK